MDTIIYKQDLATPAQLLKSGQVVAFPTETVYGLGANALDKEAVKQVFAVKGRPSDNPLIVHVESFEQAKKYIQTLHPLAEKIVQQFWPGPLTLIFEIIPGSLPQEVTGGLTTAAFRMPNAKLTLDLIHQAGVPLVGPSANTSGKPSPTCAGHVYHDLQGKIAGIVDGGNCQVGVESTVLDLSNPEAAPMILRPGAITREMLADFLDMEILLDKHLVKESETPKSPGMKYKHYSPNTPVMMVQPEILATAVADLKAQGKKLGLLASPKQLVGLNAELVSAYEDESVEAATKGLFAGLRALDEQDLDLILVTTTAETGLGQAYMNRLKKAAGQKIYEV